ncbi:MAG: hypothetical protein K8H88_09750 [Sandaracinaceae bacterium]|nr:hypothetical protein [Sandaracinaceae bacterium]
MQLAELKQRLAEIDDQLDQALFVAVHRFAGERDLVLAITARLRAKARRGRVWKSAAMLTALKNAAYGFHPERARSRGGADGVFLVDRSFRPKNEMMRKLFDGYLDRPAEGAAELAAALDVPVSALVPVRLVSHHMRLLGVIASAGGADTLVLVDYDDTK